MKFNLSMKNPDALHATLEMLAEDDSCSATDMRKARKMMRKVLEYDEYLTVQGDTETGEFVILPA